MGITGVDNIGTLKGSETFGNTGVDNIGTVKGNDDGNTPLLNDGTKGEVIVGIGTTGNVLTKRFKCKGQNGTTIGFEMGVEHLITNGFVGKFVRGTSCDVELEDLVVSDTVDSI